MPENKNKKVVLEDRQLIFRNFSGMVSTYNPEGKRSFCVLLDPPLATKLNELGYNIRYLEGRLEGDEPQAYLNVAFTLDKYPPTVIVVSGGKKTLLKGDDISMLDWAEIEHADLIIRGSEWEVNGNKGVKAYLKEAYVTIEEDPLAAKYAETPTLDSQESENPVVEVLQED